jgi:C_GCAxxG_C_C family probable redox protein
MSRPSQRFLEGLNCAQAVALWFAGRIGVDERSIKLLAAGFGGGMGGMQKTCGAVTGAYMVIGACIGSREMEMTAKKKEIRALIREFTARFEHLHGSVECMPLLDCDFRVEGEHQRFVGTLRFERCPRFVDDAVEILRSLLYPGEED